MRGTTGARGRGAAVIAPFCRGAPTCAHVTADQAEHGLGHGHANALVAHVRAAVTRR